MKTYYAATIILILAIGAGIYISYNYTAPIFTDTILDDTAQSPAPVSLPAPLNLTATKVSDTQINLAWQKGEESNGVVGYVIFRNNEQIGQTTETFYADSNYQSAANVVYSVAAYGTNGLPSASTTEVAVELTPAAAQAAANTNAQNIGTSSNPPPQSNPSPTPNPAPSPSPTPPPVPAPAPQACGSGGPCTAADVAKHNTRGDCWVYLSPGNKVYNITSYVASASLHPGGDVIVQYCGTNMYSYFLGSAGGHRHSSNAQNILQAYYVGPLQ